MKVIVPNDLPNAEEDRKPNFKARREIQKRIARMKGAPATKTDVEKFLMMVSLQRQITKNKILPMDNVDVFKNGTEVKLNYEAFVKRPKKGLTKEYCNWIEANKDAVFHIDREDDHPGFVVLAEDERYTVLANGNKGEEKPKWLFDLYSDLLVKNDSGEFVEPANIPGAFDGYADVKDAINKNEENSEETESTNEETD